MCVRLSVVCTSPPEAERRSVQDARVSVDLGKERERERERVRQDHKIGERRPPTIVRGVRARSANTQRYTFPDFISALKMLGTPRIPRPLTTNVARDSSFSRLTEALSSPNIEALFSLQRTTPLLPLA